MKTVSQAFEVFLERLIPLTGQRQAATSHRASVEASIRNAMGTYGFFENGSFSHGTGIRNYSDVDLMVRLKGNFVLPVPIPLSGGSGALSPPVSLTRRYESVARPSWSNLPPNRKHGRSSADS